MKHWRRFLAKLRALVRRRSAEQDLVREISSHLALLAEDFERRGMCAEEARQASRRAFGSVDYAKELSRDARSLPWLEQTFQDLRHCCRGLLRTPGFTLTAAITLALGIGVNVTLFTAYNAVALKPLPVADPAHVVRLERWFQRGFVGDIQYGFSYPEYLYCRDHSDVFAGLAAASWPMQVVAEVHGSAGSPSMNSQAAQGELVSSNYFSELGVGARIGSTILSDEGAAAPVVVLSDPFWQRQFHRDPHILGEVISINGAAFRIAGVVAEGFTGTSVFPRIPDFWAPLSAQKQLVPGEDWVHEPARMQLQILARLKPSIPLQRAQAETDTIMRQFGATSPVADRTKAVTLQRTALFGNTEDLRFQAAVVALMLIVGLVLLTACANIANMLLARGVARRGEIAVRLALGASRGRVVRHLFMESLLLSLTGGALGLLLSLWASKLLWLCVQRILAGPLTSAVAVGINLSPDIRVFAYTVLISLLAAVMFGLWPALRSSSADLSAAIKDEGAFLGARLSGSRLRGLLIVGQVAVSTMLLVSAGLLTRGMIRSVAATTGFETRRVLMVSVTGDSAARKGAEGRVLESLQNVPGVKSVSLGTTPLLNTWTPPMFVAGPQSSVAGRTLASYASESYFDTLGIALVRGRGFTREEARQGARVAVISESAARHFWPQEDPLGKRFQLDLYFLGDLTEFEVVGIARDVRFANLSRVDPAHVYLPTDAADSHALLVRVEGGIPAAETSIRAAITHLDRTLAPSVSLATLEDGPLRIQRSLSQMLAVLGTILASLAMILAAAGIYGVMSFLASQRVREIGIRMTMGATSGHLLTATLAEGLRPVIAGAACGVLGAAAISSVLHATLVFPGSTDLFYGVPFYDPTTFLGAAFFLLSMAAFASAFPAYRVLRVDPAVALRWQ